MLKQRILTAAVLIPILTLFILKAPPMYFLIGWLFVVMLAANEWCNLLDLNSRTSQVVFLLGVFTCCLISLLVDLRLLLALSLIFWCVVSAFLFRFPKDSSLFSHRVLKFIFPLFTMPVFFVASYQLQSFFNPLIFLLVLVVVAVTDTAAYAVGRAIGKNKLIVAVSPGKTIEGVVGGLTAAVLIGIGSGFYFLQGRQWFVWWVTIAITSLVSIIGDLFISMLKRVRGLKDTGALLPGHGGVLDRIDSWLSAIPVFLLGITLFAIRFSV